jgi:hypothetical protein
MSGIIPNEMLYNRETHKAIDLIRNERIRQQAFKNHSPADDAKLVNGELINLAGEYLVDDLESLAKAGALIVAEMERRLRCEDGKKEKQSEQVSSEERSSGLS